MNILNILLPIKEIKEFLALTESVQKKNEQTAEILRVNGHVLRTIKKPERVH